MRISRTFLALLLALGPAWRAAGAAETADVAKQLGLRREGGAWFYDRRHPADDHIVSHPLDSAEREKVEAFLKIIPAQDPDPILGLKARKALEEIQIKPEDTAWFEPDGQGGLKISALGRNAVVGILLGDTFGDKLAAAGNPAGALPLPAPAPKTKPVLDAAKARAAVASVLPSDPGGLDFDGGPTAAAGAKDPEPRPTVYLGYGTWPAAEARGRMTQGLYDVYGWGTDRVLVPAIVGPNPTKGEAAVGRALKGFLLDIPIGLIGSYWQHELGHFESAWMAGKSAYWSHSGPSNVLGILGETVWESGMTPAEEMRSSAHGIFSTQAAADDLRLCSLSQDRIPWTSLPFATFAKMDASIYGFITPPPSKTTSAEHQNWDTVDWRDQYAERSKFPASAVQKELITGAVWNAVDPMNIWSAYSYFYNYIAKGREQAPNPMLRVGDVQVLPGTGFWLSEVGPQYLVALYARDSKSKTTGKITAMIGDGSQGGVEVKVANIPASPWTKARLSGAFWMQRAAAEPGGNRPGGAFGLGLDQKAGGGVSVSVDAGYKSSGALLGRGFDAGPFVQTAVKGRL